jgi:hypothetical protein
VVCTWCPFDHGGVNWKVHRAKAQVRAKGYNRPFQISRILEQCLIASPVPLPVGDRGHAESGR